MSNLDVLQQTNIHWGLLISNLEGYVVQALMLTYVHEMHKHGAVDHVHIMDSMADKLTHAIMHASTCNTPKGKHGPMHDE